MNYSHVIFNFPQKFIICIEFFLFEFVLSFSFVLKKERIRLQLLHYHRISIFFAVLYNVCNTRWFLLTKFKQLGKRMRILIAHHQIFNPPRLKRLQSKCALVFCRYSRPTSTKMKLKHVLRRWIISMELEIPLTL